MYYIFAMSRLNDKRLIVILTAVICDEDSGEGL